MKKIKYFGSIGIILIAIICLFLFFAFMNGFNIKEIFNSKDSYEEIINFMNINNLSCKDNRLIISEPFDDVESYTIKKYNY